MANAFISGVSQSTSDQYRSGRLPGKGNHRQFYLDDKRLIERNRIPVYGIFRIFYQFAVKEDLEIDVGLIIHKPLFMVGLVEMDLEFAFAVRCGAAQQVVDDQVLIPGFHPEVGNAPTVFGVDHLTQDNVFLEGFHGSAC